MQIEIETIKPKETPKHESSRKSSNYSKNTKKNPLPQELHEGSLEAIKQFIASSQTPVSEIKLDASSQVGALFDKLIKEIVIAHTDGIQETTFFLDGDAFKNSAFHGAKITITEYNTAPKVFNVEFSAQEMAIALFEAHAPELMIALQKQDLGFSVHRLEAKYAVRKVEREEEEECS
jgi:hypothetical protein